MPDKREHNYNNTNPTMPKKSEMNTLLHALDELVEDGFTLSEYNQGLKDALLWAAGRGEEPKIEA